VDQRVIEPLDGKAFFDEGGELELVFYNAFCQGKTGFKKEESVPKGVNLSATNFLPDQSRKPREGSGVQAMSADSFILAFNLEVFEELPDAGGYQPEFFGQLADPQVAEPGLIDLMEENKKIAQLTNLSTAARAGEEKEPGVAGGDLFQIAVGLVEFGPGIGEGPMEVIMANEGLKNSLAGIDLVNR
jgi:hypothetical protein